MSKFFVEIGTSDFETFEYLAEDGWEGIFVEPVKELLDNLKRYDNCIYENCAILDKIGTSTIKYYDPEWAKGWRRGVGSLSNINNFNENPEVSEYELEKDVKVVTLDYLIEKHNVKKIDYLKIDIEGLEHRIIDDYSWKIKPDIIKIEHRHWKAHGISTKRYVQMLERMGYTIKLAKNNIYGVLNE